MRKLLALVTLTLLATPAPGRPDFPAVAGPRALEVGGFSFEVDVVVPGPPEKAFEAFTARTIEWWDHHFSENPKQLYFETVPGGGFWEIFDDAGNGARHAEILYVEKGKQLRFVGPLGLSGRAVEFSHDLTFTAAEGGTKLHLVVRGWGEMEPGWPEGVEQTWNHFLGERFKPYMEGTLGAK